ncbi:MAG: hypothetical protein UY48_C0004G0011 [Candidatus Gottesmanbacteria bacterium GW2011_GWB1_49_7]|uniref:Uncharacterized protein n=1 Tax=Candidatus Gottesmanbacteria bacterium GW2011_GWB1_49_7 TaxID=1618448 RepID=A0A0G1W320_9BACT|nr:MAG: hypothetical protein UY48_C0004G0011 [Candidatus Gottesmanbacteria bacterium GW2011_GWB1_49_7]
MDRDLAALKEQILQEVRKAEPGIASTSFTVTGSSLQPEQLKEYMKIIQDNTATLGSIRTERMTRLQLDIPKMFIGPPMTRGVTEQVDVVAAGVTYRRAPLFSAIRLDVTGQKLITYCPISTEATQAAIEQGPRFQKVVAEGAFRKNVDDVENLVWNGDAATYAAVNTDEGTLLRVLNGIGVLSQSSRIVDAEGSSATQDVFLAMIRSLPAHYINRDDLLFWMSPFVALDWQATLAERQTGGGDKAVEGGWMGAPFGIPIFKKPGGTSVRYGVPYIPTNLTLSVSVATAGSVAGTSIGPYKITAGSNDGYSLNVDAAGVVSGTFSAGVHEPSVLAEVINADLFTTYEALIPGSGAAYTHCARVDAFNHIQIISPTTGGASSVQIINPANPCWATLGFTAATYSGALAGAGSVNEGSYILLTPAKNMVLGIYTGPNGGQGADGVRVFQRFEPQYDTTELFIYSQVDVQIENLDAMVRAEDVRVSTLSP